MIISVTEQGPNVYKRCKRKWHLESRNRRNLQPMVPATALSLGTFVHSALGGWIVDPGATPKRVFLEAARDERLRIQHVFREQNGYSIGDAKLTNIDEAINLGYSMMENYELHWKAALPADFTVLAQEQRIHVPIPGTLHTEEWLYDQDTDSTKLVRYDTPRYHYLQGRLDGIIKDKHSRLYVLERKTYAARPKEEILRSTDQFVAYQWLLTQLDLGFPVAGVAYDGLWKRAAPPKKVDGRDGILADLFMRMRIEHPPEAIQEFETCLASIALEMASNPAIYPNRTSDGSCFWGCGMEELCAAMTRGEDVDYILRTSYTSKPLDDDSDYAAAPDA